jgi:enamine deaminase RidA (YjgF/YER057c/UK114 family)
MPTPEDRIRELRLTLPEPMILPDNIGNSRVPYLRVGDLLYVGGHASRNEQVFIVGKLGDTMTTEQGIEAARSAALATLTSVKAALGDLDKVVRIVRLYGMINTAPDYKEHPLVINGASELLIEVFGERGVHTRAAVGMASLPHGVAVELETIFLVRD